MQNLSIQLILNPQCKLTAVDNTRYMNLSTPDGDYIEDLTNHVSLEFLVYADDESPIESSVILKSFRYRGSENDDSISQLDLPLDGIITYYKFLVPKLEHFESTGGYFPIKDQVFFYKNNFYLGIKDIDNRDYNEDILEESAEIITNYVDIWKYINKGLATQTFSFQKVIFSVCKLQNCLVNLQKKFLENPKNCLECDSNTSIRYRRDFLLSALYVLDYLKDIKNYDEAQRILDNLASCTSLCGDDLDFNSDCGCGSIKY